MAPQWKQDLANRAEDLRSQGHQILYISTLQQFSQIAPAVQNCPQGKQVVPIIDSAPISKELDGLAAQGNYAQITTQLRSMFEKVQYFAIRDPNQYGQFAALVGLPSSETIGGQLTAYTDEKQAEIAAEMFSQQPPAIPTVVAESRTVINPNRGGDTQSVVMPAQGHPERGHTEPYDSGDQPADSLVGRVIAERYEVRREIARGGMGAVLEVFDRSLERRMAMKVMLGQEIASEEDIARFLIEAKHNAKLKHPNIVDVADQGVDNGRRYLVQEFLEGRSWQDILEQDGPMDIDDAVRYTIDAARALNYAHSRGILHRDIKPHNIMITNEGNVKIVDFGLAKKVDDTEGLTVTGQLLGTPAFMSPEQALGTDDMGTHSDTYSLGATLYAILSGRLPFEAASVIPLLGMVVNEAPEPLRDHLKAAGKRLPRDLEIIIDKSMEKDVKDRYQSANEFADDLERFLNDAPILARIHPWYERARRWAKRNPYRVLAGVAITAALTTGVGGTAIYQQKQLRDKINSQLTLASQLTEDDRLREATTAYTTVLSDDPQNATAIQGIYDLTVQQARVAITSAKLRRDSGEREQWHSEWPEYVEARTLLNQASDWTKRGATLAEDISSLERIVSGTASLDIKTSPSEARVYAYPIQNRNGLSVIRGQVVLRYFDADETDDLPGRVYLKEGQEFVSNRSIVADGVEVATVSNEETDIPGQLIVDLTGNAATGSPRPLLELVGEGYDRHLRFQWQRATNGRQIIVMQEPVDNVYAGGPITEPVYLGTTPIQFTAFPKGNYLLVIEKDGYRDVRFHELVERNERVVIRGDQDLDALRATAIRNDALDPVALADYLSKQNNGLELLTEAEINGDNPVNVHAPNIYIPPGPFYFGENQEYRWENGFRIGQYEVTNRDWKFFIDALAADGEDVRPLISQWESGNPQYPTICLWVNNSPQRNDYNIWEWPARGVTRSIAERYTAHTGLALPSYPQWVKANGVDGRRYVWGENFSPAYASGAQTTRHKHDWWNDNVHTTQDRSVYLVMDLATNAGELTAPRESSPKVILPGGQYSSFAPGMLVNQRIIRNVSNRVSQQGMRIIHTD